MFDASTSSWAGIHGGVVVGALLRAAARAGSAGPVAVTAHLHSPAAPGPAGVEVATDRAGRPVSLQATLRQDYVTRATAHVVLAVEAALARPEGWPWRQPPPEELRLDPTCLPRLELPTDVVPFGQHLDIRPVGAARPSAVSTRRIETFPKPILVAVNGLAYGGGCEVTEEPRWHWRARTPPTPNRRSPWASRRRSGGPNACRGTSGASGGSR